MLQRKDFSETKVGPEQAASGVRAGLTDLCTVQPAGGWLVQRVNTTMTTDYSNSHDPMRAVLDLCGLESFHNNSVEQIHVNEMNDQLQAFMTRRVTGEVIAAAREGVNVQGANVQGVNIEGVTLQGVDSKTFHNAEFLSLIKVRFNQIDPIIVGASINDTPTGSGIFSNHADSQRSQPSTNSPDPVQENQAASEQPAEPSKPAGHWDIFQTLDDDEDLPDVHEQPALMVIKMFVYVIFFAVILASLVCQKVCLFGLISDLKDNRTYARKREKPWRYAPGLHPNQSAAYVLLVVTLCIPPCLSLIISVLKIAFDNFKAPSVWTWILVVLMECLQTVGVVLLVFRVLPELPVVTAAMLLNATCVLPACLKAVMGKDNQRHEKSRRQRSVGILVDTVCFLVQASAVPLCVLADYIPGVSIVELTFALVLTSFSHWENFVDGRLFFYDPKDAENDDLMEEAGGKDEVPRLLDSNRLKNAVLKVRYELHQGRFYPLVLANILKVVITVTLAGYTKQLTSFNEWKDTWSAIQEANDYKAMSLIIMITTSGFVAFIVSEMAMTFQMQKVSVCPPLLLATPVSVTMLWLECQYNYLEKFSTSQMQCDPSSLLFNHWHYLVLGLAWWLSLLVMTRHIWTPVIDRTANMNRLLVNPSYCNVITAESIMMNRRRQLSPVVKKMQTNLKGEVTHVSYKLLKSKTTPSEAKVKKEEPAFTPMVYACATMWHETPEEMVALLKSIHRLDRDQYIRRVAMETVHTTSNPDFYNFEAHILFDDAMELDDDNERVPNKFVREFVKCMPDAASSVHGKPIKVHDPLKMPTPYGGQLIWQMPGGNIIFVHLKDVSKIRNRKRWSQVMYMYFLLGYKLIMNCKQEQLDQLQKVIEARGGNGMNITEINNLLGEKATLRSQNTFLLALDGDTDFTPGSVKLLLDRMKDEKVGAACGRIHPTGSGAVIWYQKFEYAMGHWLQKAAEHVFGCVLCSPGCFSLFRASALMDRNVMKRYTTEPTKARHHLQYDQGEDRWLCTLLLQQGYRIEYSAAADANTVAPETFDVFYNQRRRWMPSTIANIFDLLQSFSLTCRVNSNISRLYIGYQWFFMLMTILSPGTVLLMIAGAIKLVFGITLVNAYLFCIIPVIFYIIVCFRFEQKIQLAFAGILSVFYAFVQAVVFVGTLITISNCQIYHPSVLVILALVAIFLMAGILHPKEIWCLPHGLLYMLMLPSGYLLLVIYSIVNLNDVSWGTREVLTKAQKEEVERKKREKEEDKKLKKKQSFLSRLLEKIGAKNQTQELSQLLRTIIPDQKSRDVKTGSIPDRKLYKLLKQIANNTNPRRQHEDDDSTDDSDDENALKCLLGREPRPDYQAQSLAASVRPEHGPAASLASSSTMRTPPRDDMVNPRWCDRDSGLGNGEVIAGNKEEMEFWRTFITKYLLPIKPSNEEKEKISNDLRNLRNTSSLGMIVVNSLWIAVNFMFQMTDTVKITLTSPSGEKVEESLLGLSFVAILMLLLLLQCVGMFIHRFETLRHLLAITEVKFRRSKKDNLEDVPTVETAMREIREALKLPNDDDFGAETKPPPLAPVDDVCGETVLRSTHLTRHIHHGHAPYVNYNLRQWLPLMDVLKIDPTLGGKDLSSSWNAAALFIAGQSLEPG